MEVGPAECGLAEVGFLQIDDWIDYHDLASFVIVYHD